MSIRKGGSSFNERERKKERKRRVTFIHTQILFNCGKGNGGEVHPNHIPRKNVTD